jgi:hypothetical protein
LIQTTHPDLGLRRADMRRAYSLKMAASLACARALKMISSGKFSMHENKPFALQTRSGFCRQNGWTLCFLPRFQPLHGFTP